MSGAGRTSCRPGSTEGLMCSMTPYSTRREVARVAGCSVRRIRALSASSSRPSHGLRRRLPCSPWRLDSYFLASSFSVSLGAFEPPQGTGFPLPERDRLGIRGLLPPKVLTIEQQARKARSSLAIRRRCAPPLWFVETFGAPARSRRTCDIFNTRLTPYHLLPQIYEELNLRRTNLEKWLLLQALQDRNETLFYKVRDAHAPMRRRMPSASKRAPTRSASWRVRFLVADVARPESAPSSRRSHRSSSITSRSLRLSSTRPRSGKCACRYGPGARASRAHPSDDRPSKGPHPPPLLTARRCCLRRAPPFSRSTRASSAAPAACTSPRKTAATCTPWCAVYTFPRSHHASPSGCCPSLSHIHLAPPPTNPTNRYTTGTAAASTSSSSPTGPACWAWATSGCRGWESRSASSTSTWRCAPGLAEKNGGGTLVVLRLTTWGWVSLWEQPAAGLLLCAPPLFGSSLAVHGGSPHCAKHPSRGEHPPSLPAAAPLFSRPLSRTPSSPTATPPPPALRARACTRRT